MSLKYESVNLTKRVSGLLLSAAGLCLATANIAAAQQGPAHVELGSAGTFAILSQTGITDVFASAVLGNVGTSPITGAALLLQCGEVSGKVYTVDAAGPLPCAVTDPTFLTSAVRDMGFAYDDAAGRVAPDFIELGAGEIGGLTLAPGLYKWGTGVSITTDVTLSGTVERCLDLSGGGNAEPGERDTGDSGRGRAVKERLLAGRWRRDHWNHRALRGRRPG